MTENKLKRTPLYDKHVALGARLVPFAGWELPVRYSGVIEEHLAVRQKAGLFDVSHMGEILVTGSEAEAALNYLTCNDVSTLYDGKALYSAILNPQGGVVDDIIIYRFTTKKYLLCVNAVNSQKDFEWLSKHNKHRARFTDCSLEYGQIALQGPEAVVVFVRVFADQDPDLLHYFHFKEISWKGAQVIVARTGYTGEDGFEFFVPVEKTVELWDALLAAGKKSGLLPVGLGARDSLRLEACYPLHGHELKEDVTALESGLGWTVKFDKGDFIGSAALREVRDTGLPRKLVGFMVEDRGIVREESRLFSLEGEEIGLVTSGTRTPTLDCALGMALVKKDFSKPGTQLNAEVRGKLLKCRVEKKPFYTRK